MTDEVQQPAPRRLWPLWTVLVVVVLLLGCGLPAALVVGVIRETGARPTVSRVGTSTADDPATAVARGLSDRITAQLQRQSAALLGGDRAGFLAVADPAAHNDLRRRFAALRELKVTGWRAEPSGLPVPIIGKPGEWRLLVRFQYCFVTPNCRPSPVLIGTRWRENGDQPRMVAMEESKSVETGTRPWEISDLAVAIGPRTIVATTPALRGKLPGLLAQAEAAATVADGYAVTGSPPDRYRIFYAGRTEWQRWYGGERPEWTGGYAVTVGGGHHEVVLNAEGLSNSGTDDLLRHELTHAASLPERGYPGKLTWWLVEGLAEFAGAGGQAVDRYEGIADVRKMIRGGWDGKLEAVNPADDASAERVAASYGIGYLAVRHLVDRYGPLRLLTFFKTVVHDGRTIDAASEKAFGEQWSTLHDECVAYIRATAA
ncbi:hypothetical protein DDE19_02595 [Micromonospora ureilytica]|uniref:Peptidase MA-like domain-containing protein n=1 Tax=Micromonospora ureilytica TaxID=709868 RepID=A0A3N9Y4M9_9ACTN|nr:hypothetical protein [Micromonospora ureilytica]RQX19874.1 hypothetical protein DDE19_02595 [Micromonospora ureilytica]